MCLKIALFVGMLGRARLLVMGLQVTVVWGLSSMGRFDQPRRLEWAALLCMAGSASRVLQALEWSVGARASGKELFELVKALHLAWEWPLCVKVAFFPGKQGGSVMAVWDGARILLGLLFRRQGGLCVGVSFEGSMAALGGLVTSGPASLG